MYIEIEREIDMKNWRWGTTEKSVALREIRETDFSRYVEICRVLRKEDFKEEFETVPLESIYDLADDGPTAEDAVNLSELKTAVTDTLLTLKPREERVLRKRFGIGLDTDHTLEECAVKFSVNRERIRQIEAKALRKLKHASRSRNLRKFLPDAA
jgi:RNA polymerase sigma factor (sigma-70 family)|tara:strand:+ start:64 stop:528 length:465 start_codon:yes stop_codon:yes gene_type:complete